MTQEQNAKCKRLNDRLNELSQLNGNIGRLAFYMTTTNVDSATEQELNKQLTAMIDYRSCLENRISTGIY
jgi:hypothetical protein